MQLAGKHLVIGMTGGIAAYKVCELVRRLQDEGATVTVVMTRAAQEFVTATTMQALSGRPVFTDQWAVQGAQVANAMPHIDVSRDADAIVVAPATAHFIAQVAQGLAPDLLTTLVLARRCPLLVAPAMNVEMWNNPATQRNVQQLRTDSIALLGPGEGDQACGEIGAGRMLEPHQLLAEVVAFFQPKLLRDKRVLITAGPTFEPIDPVRGITNLSSGKMGFALARAAYEAGAKVTLIAGPTTLATPHGVRRLDVRTAQDMHDDVMAYVNHAQVFIAVAAVADWRVKAPSAYKLKKTAGAPTLAFEPNPDILASVAALPNAPFTVGFAAESENVAAQARVKLEAKKVRMVVGNLAQHALGADESELLVVTADGESTLTRADKLSQARRLIAEIAKSLP
jgi:phosphopantothenoylcysteine decarboxylase/phosphopantothenate--cysteine ligase